MDQKYQRLEGRSCCEQSIHLAVIELLPYESASVHGVVIITLVDVNPPCPYDFPLVSHGILPVDFIIDSFFPEVRHLLSSSFNDSAGLQPHAGQIVPGQG